MSSRRDRLLQQLGITQWVLRRPTALQGEVAVHLPAETKLVIVSAQPLALNTPLLSDVFHALEITEQQVYCIAPEQLAMLPPDTQCLSWHLGSTDTAASSLAGIALSSPPLSELSLDAGAKRALWQQIYHHEADIFPDASRSSDSISN